MSEARPIVMTTDHPRAQCIDLRATYGRAFRYTMDPSFDAERPEFRAVEKPWLTRIACRKGHICPWGGRDLAATSSRRLTRQRLMALPFATVNQSGDAETTVVFDAQYFDEVAAIMGARRRRPRATEAQRAVLAAGRAKSPLIRRRESTQGATNATEDGSQAVQAQTEAR